MLNFFHCLLFRFLDLLKYITMKNKTPLFIALSAGLAASAALVALFCTERGRDLRGRIRNFVGGHEEDISNSDQGNLNNRHHNGTYKKPKSDIKRLIQQVHHSDAHTEQGLSF